MVNWFTSLNGWQQFGVAYGAVLLVCSVVVCICVARAPQLEWHD